MIDGRRLPQYAHAFAAGGRVYVAAGPLLQRVAQRMWVDGASLVVECGGRRVRVPVAGERAGNPSGWYVAAGPLLRALGDGVRYRSGTLDIRTREFGAVVFPTPFRAIPGTVARPVFTPERVPTPRPTWEGPPLPRRTPLPFPPRRRAATR